MLQDDGTIGVYGHISETLVSVWQRVLAGAQIATVGNRGYSTGPHLHYKVWQQDGPKLDPAPWLRTRGVYVVGRPALSARGRYEDEWSRRCRESCRTTASTSASGGEHASAGTTCGVSPHGNNEVDVTARRSPTTKTFRTFSHAVQRVKERTAFNYYRG